MRQLYSCATEVARLSGCAVERAPISPYMEKVQFTAGRPRQWTRRSLSAHTQWKISAPAISFDQALAQSLRRVSSEPKLNVPRVSHSAQRNPSTRRAVYPMRHQERAPFCAVSERTCPLEIICKVHVEQQGLFVFGHQARPDGTPKCPICHGVNLACCWARGKSGAVEDSIPLGATELYREISVRVMLQWSEGKSSSERNASQRLGWLHVSLRSPTGSSVHNVDRRQGAQVTLNSMCSTS